MEAPEHPNQLKGIQSITPVRGEKNSFAMNLPNIKSKFAGEQHR